MSSFLSISRSLLLQLFSLSCGINFLFTLGLLSGIHTCLNISMCVCQMSILKETIKQRNKKESLDIISSSVHLLTNFLSAFIALVLETIVYTSAHWTQAHIPRTAPKQFSIMSAVMTSILPDPCSQSVL